MIDLRELAGLSGVVVVIGLVMATERALQLQKRWLPVAAIIWGIAWNLLLAQILGTPYGSAVAWGVITGLAAVGLFSGTRATLGR